MCSSNNNIHTERVASFLHFVLPNVVFWTNFNFFHFILFITSKLRNLRGFDGQGAQDDRQISPSKHINHMHITFSFEEVFQTFLSPKFDSIFVLHFI